MEEFFVLSEDDTNSIEVISIGDESADEEEKSLRSHFASSSTSSSQEFPNSPLPCSPIFENLAEDNRKRDSAMSIDFQRTSTSSSELDGDAVPNRIPIAPIVDVLSSNLSSTAEAVLACSNYKKRVSFFGNPSMKPFGFDTDEVPVAHRCRSCKRGIQAEHSGFLVSRIGKEEREDSFHFDCFLKWLGVEMTEEEAALRLHKIVRDMLLENGTISNVSRAPRIQETLAVVSPKTRSKQRDRNRKQRKNKQILQERLQVIRELRRNSNGQQMLPEDKAVQSSSEDSEGDSTILEPTSETEAEILRATNSFLAEMNEQLDCKVTVVPNMIFADNSFFTFQQTKRRHLALCSIVPTSSRYVIAQIEEDTSDFLDQLSIAAESEAIFMKRYGESR